MSFFVAGGTVPPGSPSYVERSADRELYEALRAGEFCYVLDSRQMGKSSLAVRTIGRLNEAGVKTAFLDLTRIGATGADPSQWYAGLLLELGRALALRAEATALLREGTHDTPSGRFFRFISDVVLSRLKGPIVVFIDEVDATRSLPFSADDLFAGIRQAWNARAGDDRYRRLAFCLMGAALPSDLIRDVRMTPFNVGRRIELRDFTEAEATAFAAGLEGNGEGLLRQVVAWTGGHPYLTQAICRELASGSSNDVEALVRRRYLDARARDTDGNLADAGNRLLGTGDPEVDDQARADTLALYETMLKGKPVADDEATPAAARIKMSGVARVENGLLKPRNRIYARTFDRTWVRENMPGQELRRQRRAFRRGALRTGAVAAFVIAIIAGLAILAVNNAKRASQAEAKARRDAYFASMMSLRGIVDDHDLNKLAAVVDSVKDSPDRGWEWEYWNRRAHPAEKTILLHNRRYVGVTPALSLDRKRVALLDSIGREFAIVSIADGSVRKFKFDTGSFRWIRFLDGGSTLLLVSNEGELRAFDVANGRERWRKNVDFQEAVVDRGRTILLSQRDGYRELDPKTRVTGPLHPITYPSRKYFTVSPNGRYLAWIETTEQNSVRDLVIRDRETGRELRPKGEPARWTAPRWSADSRILVTGMIRTPASDQWRLTAYDIGSGKLLWSLDPRSTLRFFTLSPDGTRLLHSGYNRDGALFDTRSPGEGPIRQFAEMGWGAILPDGRILTTHWDLRIYSPEDPDRTVRLRQGFSPQIFADGRVMASGTDGTEVASILKPETKLGRWPNPGSTWRYSDSDGTLWLQGVDTAEGEERRMQIVPFGGGAPLLDLRAKKGEGPYREDVKPFDATGGRWAALNREGKLHIYDLRTGKSVKTFPGVGSIVAFSPSGRYLAHLSTAGVLSMISVGDWKLLWHTNGVEPSLLSVGALAFSPDEREIAIPSADETVVLLGVRTGKVSGPPLAHSLVVTALAWSPDGRRLATADFKGLLHLWDRATGREATTLEGGGTSTNAVRFLEGGKSIATYSTDGTARLWQTQELRSQGQMRNAPQGGGKKR